MHLFISRYCLIINCINKIIIIYITIDIQIYKGDYNIIRTANIDHAFQYVFSVAVYTSRNWNYMLRLLHQTDYHCFIFIYGVKY